MDLAPGPEPQIPMETFAKRRARAAEGLADGEVLVVATHKETTYSNDVHHPFRPHSDFWYLTGFAEPGAIMVLGSDGRTDLWMRPREPQAEVWNGRRLGLERAEMLGIEQAHDIGDLDALHRRINGSTIRSIAGHDPTAREALRKHEQEDGRSLVGALRVRKDADEVALLQRAADVGMDGMRAALPHARPGRHEYEVEAELVRHYRANGSTGPGYPPIVGRGPNAAILHYIENRDRIKEGDLVLVDAGCEWGYYNSDITRTVPASGAFTEVQGALYETVWKAQQAALATVRPGAAFNEPHLAAIEVLVDGLVDQGLLEGDKEKLIAEHGYRPFYMHGTSHYLGLDVHDVGPYKDEDGNSTRLEEGMCITVEPGLYFNADFAQCPAHVAGIGIRIENDVMVTEDGHRDLVGALPTAPDAILDLVG